MGTAALTIRPTARRGLRRAGICIGAILVHLALFTFLVTVFGSWPSAANLAGFLGALALCRAAGRAPDLRGGQDRGGALLCGLLAASAGAASGAVMLAGLPLLQAVPVMAASFLYISYLMRRALPLPAGARRSDPLRDSQARDSQARDSQARGNRQNRTGRGLPVLLILAVAVLCMAPAMFLGSMTPGHDYSSHIQWQDAFSRQFWGGEAYPRWMADLNQGFGSPVFFIYPPLPYYATALLTPLFPGADLGTADLRLAVSATLALALGGIAMFFWLLRHSAGRIGPLLGALAFMITPYHLLIDTYTRSSFAELWSFVVMPLGLLVIDHAGRNRAAGFALLCGVLCAAILTHPPSVLILVPVFAAYALVVGARERSPAPALIMAAAVPVSGMIAAAYLSTALLPFHSFSQELFSGKYVSANALFGLGNLSNPAFPKVLYVAAGVQALAFLALTAVALTVTPVRTMRQPVVFAIGLMLVTLVMTSELSRWFWELGTPMNRIQFPWRMLGVQGIAIAVLLCAVFDAAGLPLPARRDGLAPARQKWVRYVCLASVAGLFLINLALFAHLQATPGRVAKVTPASFGTNPEPAEYRLGDTALMARRFPGGAQVAVLEGAGEARVVVWAPRHVVIETASPDPLRLTFRQFSYSGWCYRVDGGEETCAPALSPEEPLPVLDVPAGAHRVEARLVPTPVERMGWVLSAAGLLVAGAITWVLARGVPRRSRKDGAGRDVEGRDVEGRDSGRLA